MCYWMYFCQFLLVQEQMTDKTAVQEWVYVLLDCQFMNKMTDKTVIQEWVNGLCNDEG